MSTNGRFRRALPALLAFALASALLALPALAQSRAPKGGTYVNGRFYKGGQFLPKGASGGSYVPPTTFAPPPPEPRTGYRTAARTRPRDIQSPRNLDATALALSRLDNGRDMLMRGQKTVAIDFFKRSIEAAPDSEPAGQAREELVRLGAMKAPAESTAAPADDLVEITIRVDRGRADWLEGLARARNASLDATLIEAADSEAKRLGYASFGGPGRASAAR